MSLPLKLKKLFPDIDLLEDVVLMDTGEGPYIKEWKYKKAKKPTRAQLAATDTTKEEHNALAKRKRKTEYLPIGDQLDIILKQFKALEDNNILTLNKDLSTLIKVHNTIKSKYPKR